MVVATVFARFALATGLLLTFGLSMGLFLGWEAPLSASVFGAASTALLLALAPVDSFALSIESIFERRQSA
ncbi:hypothetical protein GCM10009745_54460 [Kribbella yunnanensis]|uniref:Membrane transport protein MMPL domain-containing protein n=1 Tax=Kribbella yunnanensis TaxID=190194 RepID=A0ABN2I8X5_9ACTN